MLGFLPLKIGSKNEGVKELQELLNKAGFPVGTPDGIFGKGTEKGVIELQKKLNVLVDGIVGSRTLSALKSLLETSSEPPEWILKESDIIDAANTLNVPVAAIKAIAEVESDGSGFMDDGRPDILFERHWMYRNLKKNGIYPVPYLNSHPDIVQIKPGGYLRPESEYKRFYTACTIDRKTAIESTSWGRFQIMGFHYQRLGFKTPEMFYRAMIASEGEHLKALVKFIETDKLLHKAIQDQDWRTVAYIYNGPSYDKNKYDIKLKESFDKFSKI